MDWIVQESNLRCWLVIVGLLLPRTVTWAEADRVGPPVLILTWQV